MYSCGVGVQIYCFITARLICSASFGELFLWSWNTDISINIYNLDSEDHVCASFRFRTKAKWGNSDNKNAKGTTLPLIPVGWASENGTIADFTTGKFVYRAKPDEVHQMILAPQVPGTPVHKRYWLLLLTKTSSEGTSDNYA